MSERWQRRAELPAPWRWTIWILYTLLWSTALLVPDPIKFLRGHAPRGIELSDNLTYVMAKSLHVSAYATAAILTGWLRAPSPWRWVLLLFWFLHADATELGQLLVPGRHGDLRDVAFDHVGLLIGLALSWRWWRTPPS
jgi:VanZ family protein